MYLLRLITNIFQDFDNMEEMYLLEDATHRPTQTATSYVDLAAASKALNASATASGSNAAVTKTTAPSEEYMDMN